MSIYIITGPPAAGKSTWVNNRAKPGDIRFDFDSIANLITGQDSSNHDHPGHVVAITRAARKAGIDAALRHADKTNVYIIHSSPSEADLKRYKQHDAKIVTIDPGKAVVMKRIKKQRPSQMMAVATQYYDRQAHKPKKRLPPSKQKTTQEKGLGWQHQQQRRRLLHNLKPGTPCWWCGKPLYQDKTQNWDSRSLAADHTNPRSKAGTHNNLPDRLLHATCNEQRADGQDHRRPLGTPKQHKPKPFQW